MNEKDLRDIHLRIAECIANMKPENRVPIYDMDDLDKPAFLRVLPF